MYGWAYIFYLRWLFLQIVTFLYNENMTNIQIENPHIQNSLVVVSAKEHGKIYSVEDGRLSIVEYIAEHPLEYSDNEGFFFRSAHGQALGSGAPREVDHEHNIKRYIKAIDEELQAAVAAKKPAQILIFEPEYLKGLITEHLKNPNHIPVKVVQYGNYVEQSPEDIAALLQNFGVDTADPADPQSVAHDEPNAEEKRKILEVGRKVDEQ